jgi:hypothetical protein
MAHRDHQVSERHARVAVGLGVARTASPQPDSDLRASTEEQPMKDIVIRVGGTTAEICGEQNNNVVALRPRPGRAATAPPFAHRSPVATTTDAEQPPVCGSFESTDMIWLKTPQRLPVATLTVAFATSGRSMIAHAGSSYLWFEIAWEGNRLWVIGPVQRTDDATTPLLSIALLWFERFLLAGPRLTTCEHGMTLSGPASEVSFTTVRAQSEWCVVTPARLQC